MLRLANLNQAFAPLGIVVVVTVWMELVEDLRTNHALHFPLSHLAVQGIGNDDVHVIDAMAREHIEDNLQHRLTNIRRSHRRQR